MVEERNTYGRAVGNVELAGRLGDPPVVAVAIVACAAVVRVGDAIRQRCVSCGILGRADDFRLGDEGCTYA